jgi:hypothetical protein
MSPTGQVQHLLGHRTDDVELLKAGDAAGLRELQGSGDKGFGELVLSAFGGWAANTLGVGNEIGSFKLGDIDDARDQWSHRTSRTEQEALIKAAVGAMRTNRLADMPRGLTFVGGDLHSGGLFDIETDSSPSAVPLLVSSGIGRRNDPSDPLLHTVMDESFDVAPGIKATMRTMVNDYNFGLVQVVPTGATPIIEPAVAHAGNSWAWGLRVKVGP